MAIKNRYEYLSGILEALDVEHTEAEVHNNEVWRSKVLDGMGVEHTYDDINQTDLWRAKVIEGINAMAGGGGSSDFSTATMTVIGGVSMTCAFINEEPDFEAIIDADSFEAGQFTIPLYKGKAVAHIDSKQLPRVVVTGNATILEEDALLITGDFTINGN